MSSRSKPSPRNGFLIRLYAIVAIAVAVVGFLLLVAWVLEGVWGWPRGVRNTYAGPVWVAVLVNSLLLGLFGLQHSLMARPRVKAALGPGIRELARSHYVLLAGLMSALLALGWLEMPQICWQFEAEWAVWTLRLGFLLGLGLNQAASLSLDPCGLLGWRQADAYARNRPAEAVSFRLPLLYKLVRHPIYLGFLLLFWCTPVMSLGHFQLAVGLTFYILLAIKWEERDLRRELGLAYEDYQARVPSLFPWPRPRRHARWRSPDAF